MPQMSLFETGMVLTAAPTIREIGQAYSGRYGVRISTHDNFWHDYKGEYPYFSFNECLEAGRRYLVGEDVPMAQFVKSHRSACSRWQKLAFAWARANPEKKLVIVSSTKEWEVYVRGEYVEFGLPHHDAGGERHYVSMDGKSKILVNVD